MSDHPHAWAAEVYQAQFGFVSEYGVQIVDLLCPKRGEIILDLGCGTGHLTQEISLRGARAIGVDNDEGMVKIARRNYPSLEFILDDARNPLGDNQYNAVFSNATLHWITPPEIVVNNIAHALIPGGRFVAEFGGAGNVKTIVQALARVAHQTKFTTFDHVNHWFFPTPAQYRALLENHGFEIQQIDYFDRPTRLPDGNEGLRAWIKLFVPALFYEVDNIVTESFLAKVEDEVRDELYRDDEWHADYKRLRFSAILTESASAPLACILKHI